MFALCVMSVTVLPMCQNADVKIPAVAGAISADNGPAEKLLSLAKEKQRAGKINAAIRDLKSVYRKYPASLQADDARLLLGELYEQKNDYREAFKHYKVLVNERQDSALYSTALQRMTSIAERGANGQIKVKVLGLWNATMESSQVITWMQDIIACAPYDENSAKVSYMLGEFLIKEKKYDDACNVFAHLVDHFPTSGYAPMAQMKMADLWASSHTRGNRNLVNLDKAQQAYEDFCHRFPGHKDAPKARAKAAQMRALHVEQELEVGRYYLERSREYQAAIFCFENVIRQKSVNPSAAAQAAVLLEQAKAANSSAH